MSFRRTLDHGTPLLLDAALGTELTRMGVDTRPPLWSARALMDDPERVREVHLEDARAGADLLTACTFRTHRRNVEAAGLPAARAAELTALAVRLAREAAAETGRPVFVAGSLAPLEDCYRPDLVPENDELAWEHGEQADALASSGADLILVETMNCVRELLAAVRAACATGLPVVACVVTDGEGKLLSGEPLEDAARALLALAVPPVALGVNCVPARLIGGELARLHRAAPGVPLAAYGNTGLPLDGGGWAFTEPISPEDYAGLIPAWLADGARLVGGCCGTGPAHTVAVRKALDSAFR